MRKLSLLLVFLLLTAAQLLAQRNITGKITSADDGTGIPGVTVLLKGTSNGVLSDLDGKYTISVPKEGGALQFTYVGMKAVEVAIGVADFYDVVMESEATKIEGVVVTALGISREKKSLGYSMQDVKGEELTKAREANVVNSLTGKVAGVQITNSSGAVGASSRIVLRGVTSLSGDNQPLFVVDGVPISNSNFGNTGTDGVNRGSGVADINPDDIESVSVLKGPNAAALYGSRASNGVIIITTKKGKAGKKGIGIAFTNSSFFDTPLRLPDYQNVYGQGSSGEFSFVDGANGGVNDGVDESWGPKMDVGTLIPQWDSPVVDGVRQPTPWVSHPSSIDDFFQVGTTITNNLALEGGNQDANFRISYTNFNQKGMVPNTDLKRNTFALSAGGNPSKNLTIDGNVNYVNSKSDNLPGYGYDAQNVMQQFIWGGRQLYIPDLEQYTYEDGSKRNWNYNYHNNPYFTLHENTNKMNRDRIYGNSKIAYKFTDYLSANVGVGVDNWTNWNSSRIAYTDIDNPNGYYSESKTTFTEYNMNFLIMFNKKLSEAVNLSLNFGGNMMNQQNQYNAVEAPELAVPGVYNVSNSKVAQKAYNSYREKAINSLYFNGQVSYKAIYFDFSGRNDWSSTLPTENNSYFYPSVSLSGVVSDMLNSKPEWLSLAKARLSWAQVGSDTDPYQLSPTLAFGDGWNADTKLLNQYVPNSLPNGELRPQITTSFEIGANLAFVQNRINFDFTWYNGSTTDQIIPIPISGASGYATKYVNAGEITNTGFEISLGLGIIKSPNSGFEWIMDINYAKNTNEVVELADGIEQYVLGTYWDMSVLAIPGEPMGSFYGYDFERDPNGNVVHQNGIPQQGDRKILGNYTPDWISGMNNTFRYKGVEFSFLLDYHHGGDIYTMTNSWGRYAGVLEESLIGREGGIVGTGTKLTEAGTYVPNDVVVTAEEYNKAAFSNTLQYSSVFDATYLKLREMKLGYTWTTLGPFNNLSLSLIGRNLALLYSKVPHVDPETSFSNSNVQGLEFGQLPSSRSLGFSIGMKF